MSDLPQENSWLVWMCWVESSANDSCFIYGFAAETSKRAGWVSDQEELSLTDEHKLVFTQSVIDASSIKPFFKRLEEGFVKPEVVFEGRRSSYQVLDQSYTIQPAIGHSAAQVNSFFTLPKLGEYFGGDLHNPLSAILSTLQDKLCLPFQTTYAARLGCFEVMHLNSWLDRPAPFTIDLVRSSSGESDDGGSRRVEVSRLAEFASQKHTAHIICKFDGDTTLNKFIEIAPGVLRSVPLVSPRDFDEIEAWLFSDSGELLHHEHHHLCREISGNLSLQGRQVQLTDKLTNRAQHVDRDLERRASLVRSHSSQNGFNVGYGSTGQSYAFSEQMKKLVAEIFPSYSRDKWFPKTVEAEVGVIEQFRSLLDHGRATKAILVDPFFGVDALKRFALRLESSDLDLTIVTSWADIEPDTGDEFSSAAMPTDALEGALVSINEYINPKLSVINIHANGKQAFHDRYLVLYPPDGLPEVFLLSNSLNKMSGNWPFCMSSLAPDVSREVSLYVEGLCRGEDISGSVNPTIDFRWPSNAD